jgi:hydrogenase maturation protein HypF
MVKPPFSEKQKADIAVSLVKAIIDSLSDIAIATALDNKIKTIGVTGGVSYNIPITEMIYSKVKKARLKLIVHNNVPNGDGGISIGQNAIIGYKLNS